MRKFISLLGFLALSYTISYIGAMYTMPAVQSWYQNINKPFWTPPDHVFGPVWTVLYTLIACAGWFVWQRLPFDSFRAKLSSIVMAPYWIQLILNLSWSIVFFGLGYLEAGAVVIIALLIAIWINIRTFYKYDMPSAYMLGLYFVWVAYATSLNVGIVVLN